MPSPVVSIVLPLHNAEAHLERAFRQLNSLVPSRGTFELVVINDHSTDQTSSIVAEWPSLFHGDMISLNAVDRGVSHARNQALGRCTGEYVWFVDADDIWDESILASLVISGDRDDSDVVVCNAIKVTPDGQERGRIIDAPSQELSSGLEGLIRLLEGKVQGHLWNKLFRRTRMPSEPFPNLRAHSDLGAIFGLLSKARTISYEPQTLYSYIQNPGSILNSSAYEPSNLLRCLELAEMEVMGDLTNERMANALLRFRYGNIILPIASEIGRRYTPERKKEALRDLDALRAQVRPRELVRLIRLGLGSTAARTALLNLSPHLYIKAYRRARGRNLTALSPDAS